MKKLFTYLVLLKSARIVPLRALLAVLVCILSAGACGPGTYGMNIQAPAPSPVQEPADDTGNADQPAAKTRKHLVLATAPGTLR